MAAWPSFKSWIESALDKSASLLNIGDIEKAITSGNARLWSIRHPESGQPVAGFVTEIVSGSEGRGLNVLALGGSEAHEWVSDITNALRKHAREMKCKFVFEQGRTGWTRLLSSEGWAKGPVTMVLEVE